MPSPEDRCPEMRSDLWPLSLSVQCGQASSVFRTRSFKLVWFQFEQLTWRVRFLPCLIHAWTWPSVWSLVSFGGGSSSVGDELTLNEIRSQTTRLAPVENARDYTWWQQSKLSVSTGFMGIVGRIWITWLMTASSLLFLSLCSLSKSIIF